MSNKRLIIIVLMLLMVVLSACAPNSPAANIQSGGLDKLVEDLKDVGAQVEMSDPIEDSFFPVPGRAIRVNGKDVTVFEFADEAAQQAAAATINGGGFIIGNAMIDWVDTPHFWAKDRVIVLYVGKDQAQIDLLSGLLGETVNPQAPSGGMQPGSQEPHIAAAIAALSQKIGIDARDVSAESADAVEWSDNCLGLGGPAESCLQAITPGFNITLTAQGVNYEVPTDQTGEQVRIKE